MFPFGVFLSFILVFFTSTVYSRGVNEDICTSIASNATSHKLTLMDAGSSGVRAMAYCFEKVEGSSIFDLKFQTPLVEAHQKLESNQPLSKEFTDFLVRHRPEVLPDQKNRQDFFLGATAGLRFLNGELARNILMEKSREISNLGYITEYNKNVRLLSGLEEGSYTWFGINYIMQVDPRHGTISDRVKSMVLKHHNQFGIIEMGGGSVQVAFRIPHDLKHHGLKRDSDSSSSRLEEANVKTFRLLDEYDLEVFANSQPYKGLNFAYNNLANKYLTNPAANPCLVKGTPVKENGGLFSAHGNYDDCVEAIKNTIFKPVHASFDGEIDDGAEGEGQAIFDQVYKDLLPDKFFLTGYFFDRTTAMGLPEVFTPAFIEDAARYVCNMSYSALVLSYLGKAIFLMFPRLKFQDSVKIIDIFSKEKLLQGGVPRTGDLKKYCTHLTHMSLLLKKIGLTPDHKLYTQKSLFYRGEGYGVSWPLGYAILSINGWE